MNWREIMKRSQKDAEVIFDREEPVGKPTDMVLPAKRWFRKKSSQLPSRATRAHSK